MKYLFIILCFLELKSQAQYTNDTLPWCPPGASWIFENSGSAFGYIRSYWEIKYESDTTIASIPCKKLSYNSIGLYYTVGWATLIKKEANFLNYIYMYESKDSIYKYNDSVAQFEFLYSFNALPGEYFVIQDSLSSCILSSGLSLSLPSTDTLYALNLSQDTFSQRIFRTINYSAGTYYDFASSIYNKIINKIGPLDGPFPKLHSYLCHYVTPYSDNLRTLLCYYDSLRGFVEFSTTYDNCHSIRTSIGEGKEEETYEDGWIKVYPNPTTGLINIVNTLEQKKLSIELIDIQGHVLQQFANVGTIDISAYTSGIYLLKCQSTTQVITHKILKL